MHWRWKILLLTVCCATGSLFAQESSDVPRDSGKSGELQLVERLLIARKDYQKTLEDLRSFYIRSGDAEKAKWAEQELIAYHRIAKRAFRLELDVPPPTLKGTVNIPAANRLYTRALQYKGYGWGTDFTDNQRRAELLLQELLTRYPQSNRISDAAYQLGDIYESSAYKHYRRAATYFERCFQWNPTTHFDARLRAARIYDRNLLDRKRAMEIYKEVTVTETDPARIQEAVRRMKELSGQK